MPHPGRARRRRLVHGLLAASREGGLDGLIELLDPEVVLRENGRESRGAVQVAKAVAPRVRAAQPALLDGEPGLVWISGDGVSVAFRFTMGGERILAIDVGRLDGKPVTGRPSEPTGGGPS